MFDDLSPYAGDPILSRVQAFAADPRRHKVNLSIGVYANEHGEIPVLSSVRRAKALVARDCNPCVYLPEQGSETFLTASNELVFGGGEETSNIAAVQTLGASGALRIGAEFLAEALGRPRIAVSTPTWSNHRPIFEAAGCKVVEYPYYEGPASKGIGFGALLAYLRKLPTKTVIVLQPACHNPTGADLSREQWPILRDCIASAGLVPFFDNSYQGLATSLDEDASPMRLFAQAGLRFLVATSFSKNFQLYGERCGFLSVVCRNQREADLVQGKLKQAVRRHYSSPPSYGCSVVQTILATPELRSDWTEELRGMQARLRTMRAQFVRALGSRLKTHDYDHFLDETGMFCHLDFSPDETEALQRDFAVFLAPSGRLSIAGLNSTNLDRVADAIGSVIRARVSLVT